jgi:hypothetical protein
MSRGSFLSEGVVMRKALLAALLSVGVMGKVAAGDPQFPTQAKDEGAIEASAKVKRYMYQCGLRARPADWPSNAIWLAYGSMVAVNSGSGAWIYVFHQGSGAFGWTLKQYFSLTPCP